MGSILSLALIAGLRFFGLFVVMPVLSLHAKDFGETNLGLIGFAVVAYALSQIIMQIPFGIASDKFSRKSVIAIGLVIFIIGSLVCAVASDIWWLIFGRLIQGAGAIGSVITAQIADLTTEEKRGGAMMWMGIAIFISFVFSMVIGPIMGAKYGVSSLFYLVAILGGLSVILVYTLVPNVKHIPQNKKINYAQILKSKNLNILNLSVFLQKALMALSFILIPLFLVEEFGFGRENLWKIFAPCGLVGIVLMGPAMVLSENKNKAKLVLSLGSLFFALSYTCIVGAMHSGLFVLLVTGVFMFFSAFCVHEPILQTLASKYPKVQEKGSALGIFTTYGYLGSLFGAIVGGIIYEHYGIGILGSGIIALTIIWIIIIMFLDSPGLFKNIYVKNKDFNLNLLNNNKAIIEYYLNKIENIIVIKYDSKLINEAEIIQILHQQY